MTVRTKPHRSSTRTGPRLVPRIRRTADENPVEPQQPAAPQAREREAGGPQDRASYRCSCGYVFEASVSASVACPHCGDTQAW